MAHIWGTSGVPLLYTPWHGVLSKILTSKKKFHRKNDHFLTFLTSKTGSKLVFQRGLTIFIFFLSQCPLRIPNCFELCLGHLLRPSIRNMPYFDILSKKWVLKKKKIVDFLKICCWNGQIWTSERDMVRNKTNTRIFLKFILFFFYLFDTVLGKSFIEIQKWCEIFILKISLQRIFVLSILKIWQFFTDKNLLQNKKKNWHDFKSLGKNLCLCYLWTGDTTNYSLHLGKKQHWKEKKKKLTCSSTK